MFHSEIECRWKLKEIISCFIKFFVRCRIPFINWKCFSYLFFVLVSIRMWHRIVELDFISCMGRYRFVPHYADATVNVSYQLNEPPEAYLLKWQMHVIHWQRTCFESAKLPIRCDKKKIHGEIEWKLSHWFEAR